MKVPQFAVAGRPACSNPRHILMKGDFQIMTRYVVKRILLAIVSVLVICAITFFAMNAIPGGPFNSEKALSEATKAVLMERYNLDKPVPVQFVLYMRNLLRGDFGVSLKTGRDISGTLFSCFKVSARLGATAAVCAVACGIVLGSLAALFRNRLIDRVIVFFTTLFTAMPSFVFATFLMLVFCITLKWLPVWDASNEAAQWLWYGLICGAVSIVPLVLSGRDINFAASLDRFSWPGMIGAILFLAGLLCGISGRNDSDLAEDAHLAMLAK